MKALYLISMIMLLIATANCATRVRIMNAAAVSMTESSLNKKALHEIGLKEDKSCPDASPGTMDEAVRSAQTNLVQTSLLMQRSMIERLRRHKWYSDEKDPLSCRASGRSETTFFYNN